MTAAAMIGPARQPRPTSSAPATFPSPPHTSKSNSNSALVSAVAVPAMEYLVQRAHASGRPIGEERLADDIFHRQPGRIPVSSVLAVGTIIAHDEHVPLRDYLPGLSLIH